MFKVQCEFFRNYVWNFGCMPFEVSPATHIHVSAVINRQCIAK